MDSNFLRNIPFAHRGLHNKYIKENTLNAFRRAITFGYGIELDVRLSKDKKLIVYHDKILHGLNIEDLDYLDILTKDKDITTLDMVLRLVKGRVPLLIELKNTSDNKYLCHSVYSLLKNYKGLFAIQSFNISLVNCFRKNYEHIPRGITASYISEGFLKIFKNGLKSDVKKTKPNFISFKVQDLPNGYIKKLRNKLVILSWTVRSNKEANYAKEFSDNIIFENFMPKK